MNVQDLTFRALLCLGLFSGISCTKTVDNASNDSVNFATSDNLTSLATNELSGCKLRSIYHENLEVSGTVKGLFTYNSAGNPLSLTYGNQAGQENPNHYFFYDRQNRLREYRKSYPHAGMEYADRWHKYGYNSSGVLVLDSAIAPGVYNEDGSFLPGDTTLITLTYDAQGRISKETIKNPFNGSASNPTYTYDNRGNLAVKGWKSSSYDNKVSIFRAHPIFQFIHRNYSVNNAAPQASYNSKGLPLSLNPSNDWFFNSNPTVFGSEFGITKATYDCQ